MQHYLLTRAVYDPAVWAPDDAARRLALFEGVTVRGLAAQTQKNWRWLLAVHPDDELLGPREDAVRRVGVPYQFITCDPHGAGRSQAAIRAYQVPWRAAMTDREPRLMTRLDDDDTFAPDAFERLRDAVLRLNRRTGRRAWMQPVGFRVFGDLCTRVVHRSNAMHSLQVERGDPWTVYTYRHRNVREYVRVLNVDNDPAWLWLRHPDTLSGWQRAAHPINDKLRGTFPVDWDLLARLPRGLPAPGGDRFP